MAGTRGDMAALGFGVGPAAAAMSKGWGGEARSKGDDWDVTQSWQVTGWLLIPSPAVYPSGGPAPLGDRSKQDSVLGPLGVGTAAATSGSISKLQLHFQMLCLDVLLLVPSLLFPLSLIRFASRHYSDSYICNCPSCCTPPRMLPRGQGYGRSFTTGQVGSHLTGAVRQVGAGGGRRMLL